MKHGIALATLIAALVTADLAAAQPADTASARGKAILAKQCGECHQVEPTGASPLSIAPPFYEVMQRYGPENLEEALGEGLSTGHPAMPEFVFEPEEIAAIVTYLGTLRDGQ